MLVDNDSVLRDVDLECQREIKLLIPQKCVGLIIGKGGTTLTKTREDSEASIRIDDQDDGGAVAFISGSLRSVVEAAIIIGKSIKKAEKDDEMKLQVFVPVSEAGMLIGRGGANVKAIAGKAGAQIALASQQFVEMPDRLLRINGPDDAVARGLALSHENFPATVTLSGSLITVVAVADAVAGKVIGGSGKTLKRIQAQCKAAMSVGPRGPKKQFRSVTIIGRDNNIVDALKMINQLIAPERAQMLSPPSPYKPGQDVIRDTRDTRHDTSRDIREMEEYDDRYGDPLRGGHGARGREAYGRHGDRGDRRDDGRRGYDDRRSGVPADDRGARADDRWAAPPPRAAPGRRRDVPRPDGRRGDGPPGFADRAGGPPTDRRYTEDRRGGPDDRRAGGFSDRRGYQDSRPTWIEEEYRSDDRGYDRGPRARSRSRERDMVQDSRRLPPQGRGVGGPVRAVGRVGPSAPPPAAGGALASVLRKLLQPGAAPSLSQVDLQEALLEHLSGGGGAPPPASPDLPMMLQRKIDQCYSTLSIDLRLSMRNILLDRGLEYVDHLLRDRELFQRAAAEALQFAVSSPVPMRRR